MAITKKDLRRAESSHPSQQDARRDPKNVRLQRFSEGGVVLSDRDDVMDGFEMAAVVLLFSNYVI